MERACIVNQTEGTRMSGFNDNSPSLRASRYLELAAVARHRSAQTDDLRLKTSYDTIASGWEALALQLNGKQSCTPGTFVDAVSPPTTSFDQEETTCLHSPRNAHHVARRG